MPPRSVMFVAGDPSGDLHAAPILKNLRQLLPTHAFWGIGGPKMTREGFDSLLPFEPFNKMGFVEVALHIRFFLKAKKFLVQQMIERKPDVVVCVDYPGFNTLIMQEAKKLGIPVIWYIAPMVWAWKKKRAEKIASHCSHIAVIFPFETTIFESYGAKVSFVGNPTAESIVNQARQNKSNIDLSKTIKLAIVPGSRKQEIERILPVMLDAFKKLKQKYPNLEATVSKCQWLPDELFREAYKAGVQFHSGELVELLQGSHLTFIKSGTATLEAALIGIPMVIIYKTSLLTYNIAKRLVKIPYIGLPNILSRERIVPELIQDEANPEEISKIGESILSDKNYLNSMQQKLSNLQSILSNKKPSLEVAQIIYSSAIKNIHNS